MAIIATYRDNTHEVKNAYIRVERIWGCKAEGWNAWVHVYAHEGDTKDAAPVFSVYAPYIDGQNPFVALYEALEKLPFIVKVDLPKEEHKVVEEVKVVEEIIAIEPKKSKGKKKVTE